MRRRRALVLALLVPLLAACGSQDRADAKDAVPAKICGIFDRDKIVALGLPLADITSRGRLTDADQRRSTPLRCTVGDRRSGHAVVKTVVGELDSSEADDATQVLEDEYQAKRRSGDDTGVACSQPDSLSSVGTGYVCKGATVISVAAVVPGRLVRMHYRPLRSEAPAVAYARAVGLIGNLQENIVAWDQTHPTPTPSSASPSAG